jgi:hypothetical protein
MFFIATGCAYAKRRTRLGVETFLGKLDEGCHFGDIALFYKSKRTATIIAGEYSTMAKMTSENYEALIS